jgi:hypothetical protein
MPAGLHLQARDIRILAEIGELGALDTDTIHQRFFPNASRRRCQQRLQSYQAQGLTRIVTLSVWFGDGDRGRVPAIHCLTERGGDAVEAAGERRPRRVLRSEPKPETFHHRLAVVKARLAMDDACSAARLRELEWIMEHDRCPAAAAADKPPLQQRWLYHAFSSGQQTLTCLPDAASLIRIPRDPRRPDKDTSDLVAYWEIDCSTERRTQIVERLPGYAALVEQQGYRRYWPQVQRPAVRVFWVCRSEQRIVALCEKLKDAPIAKVFRFTTADELTATNALVRPIWRDTTGGRREILRLAMQLVGGKAAR